jgi:AraC family transcriptional regulator of adaptative response/methylated-DNA-[protein]-cysteine methyltransferase
MSHLTIHYSFHTTALGTALIASTQQGICHLSFVDDNEHVSHRSLLQKRWPQAQLVEQFLELHEQVARVCGIPTADISTIPLHMQGTPFQQAVWRALLTTKPGMTTSYSAIAQFIGQPTAVRAAASAIANNRIAVLIPCHRIIKKNGQLHNYRWGADRKKLLLEWEKA